MADIDAKISELEGRLESLVRTQIDFQSEITTIRRELTKLRGRSAAVPTVDLTTNRLPPEPANTAIPLHSHESERPIRPVEPVAAPTFGYKQTQQQEIPVVDLGNYIDDYLKSARGNVEKFIGENLISKIGIVILLLGIGIGAKFAIDNGWITPLMRVIAGYSVGVGLIGLALKLKAKYHNYSAVIMSGGLATIYLITFFAYSYYALIPMTAAFAVMVLSTISAVGLAIVYDRQVIAHFGLVGAYTIPFLLSTDSGNYLALFAYMAIVNVGILAVSIRKYWLPLFFTSFAATWLIYLVWLVGKFRVSEHFNLALIFLGIFFAIFYATKLIQLIVFTETDETVDKAMLFGTVSVFYGFLYGLSSATSSLFDHTVLFTFLAVATVAVLTTSFRFYDRLLVYFVNPAVWWIFGVWFATEFRPESSLMIASIFASTFFAIFYFVTIFYRLMLDRFSSDETVGLVISNGLIFYGFGYAILDSRQELQAFQGLFTAGHAALHSVVSQVISRIKPATVDLVQALAILIITFATAAIPVQFDGRVVTLIWSIEAAALFWFGRVRLVRLFEYFSFPVMALAIVSQMNDWFALFSSRGGTGDEAVIFPILNGYFVSAVVLVAAFAFIYRVNRDKNHDSVLDFGSIRYFGIGVGAVVLVALYNLFRVEIGNYYAMRSASVGINPGSDSDYSLTEDLVNFNVIWQINYSLLFTAVVSLVNIRKIRSVLLVFASSSGSLLFLAAFSTVGMLLLYSLRRSFLADAIDGIEHAGMMNIAIRFVSYLFVGISLYSLYRVCRDDLFANRVPEKVRTFGFDAVFAVTLFITTSCELVHVLAHINVADRTKLGLSIWWAVFAVAMIVVGMAWRRAHLRFAAIGLLAVTLAKLFLYDVADLPTIQKTILFVTLGTLLLVVSFLYNKYRTSIFGADEELDDFRTRVNVKS
ncbi:MAG: DUF2339 domain-containing protein [Blastocatellia bacterium]|nr:DUF2339 domain-containing protein [Blastocatellia bacterium]